MDKQTIVVVGAGKGMGNHIAKKFAENNFRVVLISRNKEKLLEYKKEFEGNGFETYIYSADAKDINSLKEAFDRIKNNFEVVDVLVYNTAILKGGFPSEISNEEFMEHFQVDVASALFCTQQVTPAQIKKKKGTILFTGGGFAINPTAEYTCISVNKAALRALAFTLNQELSDKGIFTGIVSIMGNIQEGTHFAPDLIAEKYWELYTKRKEPEIIYD